jgi:small-conductance mechanosensitive channel
MTRNRLPGLVAAVLAVVFLILGAAPGAAQLPGEIEADGPEMPVTETDLARISDAELRALVLERLDRPADAGEAFNPAVIALQVERDAVFVRQRLGDIVGAYGQLPDAFATAGTALVGDGDAGDLAGFALTFALALAAGWLGERLVRRRTLASARPPAEAGQAEEADEAEAEARAPPLRRKADRLAAVLFGRAMLILLFALIAAVAFLILHGGNPAERTAFGFYLAAIVMLRLVAAAARTFLALDRPAMRISTFGDGEARGLYRLLLAALAVGAFGFFTCALFARLGVHGDVHLLMLLIVGTVTACGVATVFLVHRTTITRDLAGPEGAGPLRRRFAKAYPFAMAAGSLAIWAALVVSSLLGAPPVFGAGLATLGLLVLWPGLDAAASREMARCAEAHDDVTPAVLRVLRVGFAVATLFGLLLLWRVDLMGEGAGLGALLARGLLEIGAVVLLAYAAWEVLTIRINRRIAEEDAARAQDGVDLSDTEIGGTGMTRMRTLLPLFKRAGQITIAVIAFMIVLSAMGVDIGPVLAGAGVVGIAIGFGSQTLVRDVVSGAFFLMDDAFRLGEYIDLGSVRGSVEKISTRSLQLRHHRGALHTVPFGEIQTLTNYSRDWAIMKLRFRVPFDTDIEKTRKIVKNVGKELMEHPDVGPDFLQPFKSQGVVEVDDYGLVISTKFMSKPGKQFLIRRYAYAAVQKAFAEHGIQFARPEVRVSVGEAKRAAGEAEEQDTALALGAAALTKINQPKPEAAAGA